MAGKPSSLPPLERLKELFAYDPETGLVTRRVKRGGEIVGSPVGTKNSHGHLICRVDYRICYVHRIAWALHYSIEPPAIIDHRNGDGSDNRITNLRPATPSANSANTKASCQNRSGLRGVHWSSAEKRWRSSIRVNGRRLHLGWFDTPEEAQRAYASAAAQHFGEFSYYRRRAKEILS